MKKQDKLDMWAECGDDFYFGREGEKVDYEIAFDFYQKAAKKKHPYSLYRMGCCYELGKGVKRDAALAKAYYSQAAALGNTDAAQKAKEIKLPAMPDYTGFTYDRLKEVLQSEKALQEDNRDPHILFIVVLLMIKAARGKAALLDADIVRAYLYDLVPSRKDLWELTDALFDTGAAEFLQTNPAKAAQRMKAEGIGWFEAESVAKCFAAALNTQVNTESEKPADDEIKDYEALDTDELKALAEQGDAEAMYTLGTWYMAGEDEELDGDESEAFARQYLRQAADAGHEGAAALLETLPDDGEDEEEYDTDEDSEDEDLLSDEEKGAIACRLAILYIDGRDGYEKNIDEAVRLLEVAAGYGYMKAYFFHAMLLLQKEITYGDGDDDEIAAEEMEKAAQSGYAPAMNVLGRLYWQGRGVKKSILKATEWLEKGTALGDKDSALVLEDLKAEKKLLNPRIITATASELCESGTYYYQQKDYVKALRYFERSAMRGNTKAMIGAALIYEEKEGFLFRQLAYYWMSEALWESDEELTKMAMQWVTAADMDMVKKGRDPDELRLTKDQFTDIMNQMKDPIDPERYNYWKAAREKQYGK